jgi:hypothetical protein
MPFITSLTLEDEEKDINILHCDYKFTQAIDATGMPISNPQGGLINLVIQSNGSTNLFDWMVSPDKVKKGVITFYRDESPSSLIKLEFADTYCVGYYDVFDNTAGTPMLTYLTLSATSLKLNGAPFKNPRPRGS